MMKLMTILGMMIGGSAGAWIAGVFGFGLYGGFMGGVIGTAVGLFAGRMLAKRLGA